MKRAFYLLLFLFAGAISIVPLIFATADIQPTWMTANVVAGINLLGWSIVITFLIVRAEHHRHLLGVSNDLGIDPRRKSLEQLLDTLIFEVRRKQQALSISAVERRISSKEELSRALEKVVGLAFKLLDAESAELALFDREAQAYHSSFVMGKPFRTSAQAMLSGAYDSSAVDEITAADVIVKPISFAGSVLGTLRVALHRGRLPSQSDHELLSILALQSSVLLINAQFTQELLQMRRVSEESVKAKTGFLANLSHELRGPLGIIMNSVELVLDGLCGPVNEDQLETLRMVRSNGEHLLELINDVLDYAKIESGRIKPATVEIEANEILADISSVIRAQAEAKSHKVTFKKSDDLIGFACDRRHFRQIMINMLTNAIKYTPDNGVIELWAERIAAGKVKINVKDSGVGISEEDRAKVFSAFERIEHSYSSKQVGAGLGMSLTQHLVHLNGGSIDFTSAPGKGSHFWIVLPGVEYDPSMQHDRIDSAPRIEGHGEAIVLMDPDDSARSMFVRALNARGYKCHGAAGVSDALLALSKEKVGAIVVDDHAIQDGEESFLKKIHEIQEARSVPVIMLTSRAFVFDTEKFLKNGVDRCVSKPARFDELAHALREVIDSRKSVGARGVGLGSSDSDSATKANRGEPKTKVMSLDDILH